MNLARPPERAPARLIGGLFGLEVNEAAVRSGVPFLREGDLLLVNGRSALHTVVRALRPRRVWLPSYLCKSLLDALHGTQSAYEFYPVGADLRTQTGEWLQTVHEGDIVVVIDYFGFPAEAAIMAAARNRGAWAFEDASQALLTRDVGHAADFVAYSLRKFIGVPDGGILSARTGEAASAMVAKPPLMPPPREWWHTALKATMQRREFDLCEGPRAWFELFQESERRSPVGCFAMSGFTQDLLPCAFDYEQIATRRRANYGTLSTHLSHIALYPDLPPEVVPLGFPVRVPRRDAVRSTLFMRMIFPPIHWALDNAVPLEFTASHELAAEVMTLPCDQRYDAADMERMAMLAMEAIGS